MGLLRIAGLGVLGYLGYRAFEQRRGEHAAFAPGQGDEENFAQVRNAGPESMADPVDGEWTSVDEQSDESFPASDPPANY